MNCYVSFPSNHLVNVLFCFEKVLYFGTVGNVLNLEKNMFCFRINNLKKWSSGYIYQSENFDQKNICFGMRSVLVCVEKQIKISINFSQNIEQRGISLLLPVKFSNNFRIKFISSFSFVIFHQYHFPT
jgi:hypothetical protein